MRNGSNRGRMFLNDLYYLEKSGAVTREEIARAGNVKESTVGLYFTGDNAPSQDFYRSVKAYLLTKSLTVADAKGLSVRPASKGGRKSTSKAKAPTMIRTESGSVLSPDQYEALKAQGLL